MIRLQRQETSHPPDNAFSERKQSEKRIDFDAMHISSQSGSNVHEYLEQIQKERATLRTVSAELFLELEDFWVDKVRLTDASPTTKLLDALQSCPSLSSLHFYSPRATSTDTIPLLLKCFTPKLTSLSITRSVRFETIKDVTIFAEALSRCRNLSDFKLVHPHCNDNVPIDAILRVLGDLPLLQSVDVTLFTASTCNTTFVSPSTLHAVLRSPSIKALSLWGCGIHDRHLKVLQQGSKLSFLSLRRNPQITDWKPFYHSLETNVKLKALYNDHADLMSCMHPTLPNHSPDATETAAVCAAEICLALNRLGRGEEESDEDFYDMIEAVNESSMALYYLLRSRPDIWCDRTQRERQTRRLPIVLALAKPTGLTNLGNTCYLNSQLQCAHSIPKVRNQLIDSGNILGELFAEMNGDRPISARSFCRALGIPVFEQQDSQEFWKLLLPTLQLPDLLSLYKGELENYIRADDGRERRKKEPFLDLSLDITDADSIEEAIHNSYLQPELLSAAEGNGWRPEKGAEQVDAEKGATFTPRLPSILQLHLKRFQFDWQTETMSKLNKRITFPLQLQLPADVPDCEYTLQAIVVHAGEYGAGHYYAYVRPNPESEDWFRCNDDTVDSVSWEDVSKDAFGGREETIEQTPQKKRNPLIRILCRLLRPNASGRDPYGFGGRTSSAYVVQYVRRCEIDSLFAES